MHYYNAASGAHIPKRKPHGFGILLYSIVYEWIFDMRVLSTQPKTLSISKVECSEAQP